MLFNGGGDVRIYLWRILGNDVPPRHSADQTERILNFVLGNESAWPLVEKVWLINRIYDDEKRERLAGILAAAGCRFFVEPFDWDVYRGLSSQAERRLYLTNVNVGRNYCVRAVYSPGGVCYDPEAAVAPFDGGIALRDDGVAGIRAALHSGESSGFLTVPMWRVPTFDDFLNPVVPPNVYEDFVLGDGWRKTSLGEPQVLFLPGADLEFDESLPWGMAPKVELLWRLLVPGMWDRWQPDLKRRAYSKGLSRFAGSVARAGYACRLPSGNPDCEQNNLIRGAARTEGWKRLVAVADAYRR